MTTMAMTFTTKEPSKRDKPVVNKVASFSSVMCGSPTTPLYMLVGFLGNLQHTGGIQTSDDRCQFLKVVWMLVSSK
jgi:hypothetical protein